MAEAKGLRPGMARVQFLAVQHEVKTLLEQGHTYASAYDMLKDQKKVSMSYQSFRKHIHKYLQPRATLDGSVPSAPVQQSPVKNSLSLQPSAVAAPAPLANHGIEPAALLESGSVHQTSVAIRNGPIRVASKNSQFDSNDFDVIELGTTWL